MHFIKRELIVIDKWQWCRDVFEILSEVNQSDFLLIFPHLQEIIFTTFTQCTND